MKDLLSESKYLTDGCLFGFKTFIFKDIHNINNHFLSTGENVLDIYLDVCRMAEMVRFDLYFDYLEIAEMDNKASKMRALRIVDISNIYDAKTFISNCRTVNGKYRSYINDIPRKNASKYISSKKVRQTIFDIHGRKCLCCGSENSISLDHVVPVSLKGTNEIYNLQPLCKSCNSKKGTKIIDYRKI